MSSLKDIEVESSAFAGKNYILFNDGSSWTATPSFLIKEEVSSYILEKSDAGYIVEINSALPASVTVPPSSFDDFPIGTSVMIVQSGSGEVTISPGLGVTINSQNGFVISGQWGFANLVKRAQDNWVLVGNLKS